MVLVLLQDYCQMVKRYIIFILVPLFQGAVFFTSLTFITMT